MICVKSVIDIIVIDKRIVQTVPLLTEAAFLVSSILLSSCVATHKHSCILC